MLKIAVACCYLQLLVSAFTCNALLMFPSRGNASPRLDSSAVTFADSRKALANILTAASVVFSCSLQPTTAAAVATTTTAVATTTQQSGVPKVYGLKQGRLLPCKSTSNCLSTSSINSVEKYGRPWAFEKDANAEFDDLIAAVNALPDLKLVESDTSLLYARAEAKSAFPPTGIDDVEFLLNAREKLITYRSNSRELLQAGADLVGDAGSNRNRLEAVRRRLGVAEMDMSEETAAYVQQVTSKMSFLDRIKAASQPNEINFIDNSVPEN